MRHEANVQTGGDVYCDYFEMAKDITLVIGWDAWYVIEQSFDNAIEYVDVDAIIESGDIY